jgi:putative transposase
MAYWELFYHLVWTTHQRLPLLTPEIEPFVHRLLAVKCSELEGYAFAVNGMMDHVHVVAAIPPKASVASFVGALKGSSSRFVGLKYKVDFQWQSGYGAFSFSGKGLEAAVDYVRRQKEHHETGGLVTRLERVSDENAGPPIIPPNKGGPLG